MRILQINPRSGNLSTGRVVSELDNYFTEQGHESYVAYFEGFYNGKNGYKIGNLIDRKLHSFLSALTGYEACFSTFSTIKLINYIKKVKPDVIRLAIVHSHYLNYYMLLDFIAKEDIPLVLTLDDCWHFTGKCVHYTENNCYKWKEECGNCQFLSNGLRTWYFDRTKYLLQKKKKYLNKIPRLGIVGVSDWLVNEAKQSILCDAKIIKRIYNWINFEKFYPRENFENIIKKYDLKNKFIILSVATTFSKNKGINDFIKLAEQIDENSKIILVGKIVDANLPNNIIHINRTNDIEELAKLYSLADIFVTFSKEETFGKVSAESLACGTPIICYNTTASPELVGENCGYVSNNFDDFVININKIKEHGKEYYKDYCVKFSRENFEYKKNVQEYINLFDELNKS